MSTYSHSGHDADGGDDGFEPGAPSRPEDSRRRLVDDIREAIRRGSYDVDVRLEELTAYLDRSIRGRDDDATGDD